MKRILYIEDGESVGGSIISLYLLIKNIDKNKYTPIVIFPTKQEYSKLLEELGIRVIYLLKKKQNQNRIKKQIQRQSNKWYIFKRLYNYISELKHYYLKSVPHSKILASIIRNERIDLVHCNNSLKLNSSMVLACKRTGTPCIVHVRRIEKLNFLERNLSKYVIAFICISNFVKRHHNKQLPKEIYTTTIYNAVEIYCTEKKLPIAYDVISLGRLIEWKGQEYLIEAMKILAEDSIHPRTIILGDGPTKSKLQNAIVEYKLLNIQLLGFKKNITEYINRSKILVHTSTRPEPFGRVLIEGMIAGKPVIAVDTGACPEIIKENETGFLVPPNNPDMIAKRIKELIQNEVLQEKLGQAGRSVVKEKFGVRKQAQAIQKLYKLVLE